MIEPLLDQILIKLRISLFISSLLLLGLMYPPVGPSSMLVNNYSHG